MTWPAGDPNAVIHAVLAQPEFRNLHGPQSVPSPLDLWLGHAIDAIRAFLRRQLEGSAALAHVAVDVLLTVVYGIGAIGLVVVAYVVVTNIAARSGGAAKERIGRRGLPREATPEQIHGEASAAAASGSYGTAIALLFRAALVLLDRAGLVAFDPARGPREYRRIVRAVLERGSDAFDEVALRFVWSAFGERAAERRDYEAAERSYAELFPLVGA